MRDLFMRFTLLSGTGGLVVLALHFAKPLLRRVPAKWYVWLWLLLGLRMLVPFGFAPPKYAQEIVPIPGIAFQGPAPAIVTPTPATQIASTPAQMPTDWLLCAALAVTAAGIGPGLVAAARNGDSAGKPVYPTNIHGETYGVAPSSLTRLFSLEDYPDLIAATGEGGIDGYIRQSEADPFDPKSPEEALKWQEEYQAQGGFHYCNLSSQPRHSKWCSSAR
ncbi:MAG: hypothetical protein FWC27_00200 [Firmicutes bacterium]|nr:hypothetical protein [Bacillota bacterium]